MKNLSFNDKLKILSIIFIGVVFVAMVVFALVLFAVKIHYGLSALFYFAYLVKGILYGALFIVLSIFLYAFGVLLDKIDEKK